MSCSFSAFSCRASVRGHSGTVIVRDASQAEAAATVNVVRGNVLLLGPEYDNRIDSRCTSSR